MSGIANPDVRTAALAWLGTPFRPRCRVLGVGVDCVQLLAAVYIAVGRYKAEDLRWGYYPMDRGLHSPESLIERWIERCGRFDEIPRDSVFVPGDVVGFQLGKAIHHAGLVTEGVRFVHASPHRGVIESRLDDPTYARRLAKVWRWRL